jgi:crotonobetaine/carnitine-CoA ligase
MRMLLAAPATALDNTHGARTCFSVGTPAAAGKAFEERFGVNIVEGYGLTECGAITYQWSGARRLGSAGRPTPGWQVAIHDADGMSLPTGEIGEIVGRPDRRGLMMDGYVGRPQATLEVCKDLWFHTGDRGYLDDDGYLWFVDRQKDSIRRRGENISSYEIEEAIRQTGLCVDSAAFAVPSALGEDEVMVAVVPKEALDPVDLVERLSTLLPGYALPSYVRTLDEMPRTPTGKIQKFKLRGDGVTNDTWSATGHTGSHPAASPTDLSTVTR